MQTGKDERQGIASTRWLNLRACIARNSGLTILCSVLAALLLLVAFIVTQPLPHYILVLDSGSTGTRIYAYTWKERRHQLPIISAIDSSAAPSKVPRRQGGDTRAYERVETEPGLATFTDDLAGVRQAVLGPLLAWAEEVIPASRHKETPIFLFATAGLRNLPKQHQDNLLVTVRNNLRASPFRFQDSWARTVTGEREGIYGWIALNYLTGHLAPHPLTASRSVSQAKDLDGAFESLAEGNTVLAASENLKTLGSLDLGGSSLEVTFMPMKISSATVTANVSILGVQYSLFSQTHHEHGLDSAFNRTVALLLEKPIRLEGQAERHYWGKNHAGLASSKTRRTGNLDYATGLQVAASKRKPQALGEIASKQARKAAKRLSRTLQTAESQEVEVEHPCLHDGYRKVHESSHWDQGSSVMLVGRPNWQACEQLVSLVINSSQSCEEPPCALESSQPLTTQPMYALTGFYVVYHFFGLQPTATLEELEKKGRRFCDTDWTAIAGSRGSEVHVESYCFRSLYVIKLLRQGLGLPEAQIRMGSGREAWTLGAALAEGGKVGAGLDLKQHAVSRRTVFVILTVALLFWCCLTAYCLTTGSKILMDRKLSGQVTGPTETRKISPARQTKTSPHNLPPLPRNASFSQQGSKAPSIASPTAVIAGGDFNTNVARFSAFANQRKRNASIDDLTSLR